MKLEILIGLMQNFSFMAGLVIICWVVAVVFSFIGRSVTFDERDKKQADQVMKGVLSKWPFILPLLLLCCMPRVDDLWKIRISLIKLELSSPENLNKASVDIERIGHKLECKYLGCDKEEKK